MKEVMIYYVNKESTMKLVIVDVGEPLICKTCQVALRELTK